jgi:nucleoside-diphosphate-sugar epimerase
MKRYPNVLITGASGFVGKKLANSLLRQTNSLTCLVRRFDKAAQEIPRITYRETGEINSNTDWSPFLEGMDVIIHLAARAHILNESTANPLDEYRKANTQNTLQLAHSAAKAKVKRFIFVSSIGVNGSASIAPFNEASPPNPTVPYAISKLEAEQGLREIATRTVMEAVIVRPPLVYGPNCPGNFLRLLDLVYKGLPLPFGSVNNLRSLIGVNNLTDFLVRCVEHPAAANKTFLIADKPDISTPDMMRVLAQGMDRPSRLIPAPYGLIRGVAGMFGRRATLEKLCGTLQIDSSFARKTLGWSEPLSLHEGLLQTGQWYARMVAEKRVGLGKK